MSHSHRAMLHTGSHPLSVRSTTEDARAGALVEERLTGFVSLRDVSFAYPGRNTPSVIANLDLDLRRGEFFVLLGPSGCGKTTVLNMLAGFERASAGKVLVAGRPVDKPEPTRLVIFQGDDSLLSWLTTIENVEFGLRVQH